MSKIHTKVMASVLIVYTLRRVLSAFMLKAYALIIASITLFSTVSVPNIVQNLIQVGIGHTVSFVISAALSTTFVVQALCAAIVLVAVLLVRDSFRAAAHARAFN